MFTFWAAPSKTYTCTCTMHVYQGEPKKIQKYIHVGYSVALDLDLNVEREKSLTTQCNQIYNTFPRIDKTPKRKY